MIIINYICDYCKLEMPDETIVSKIFYELNSLSTTGTFVYKPPEFDTLHFCSNECLIDWCKKQKAIKPNNNNNQK